MSIRYKSVENLLTLVKDKKIRPSDVVKDIYDVTGETDPTIKSFLALNKESTIKKARELDELQVKDQMDGKLFDIPMDIKDNIITSGSETTYTSKMLEGFVPIYESIVMERLHNKNVVSVGKLSMDEFAMGDLTETFYFKEAVSPLDHKAVPGGLSGGSTATITADLIPFSLDSDTDGSVRQPTAYCGVVSMKPAYGRVSRFGLVAFTFSLGQIGPLTRDVKDSAIVLEVISGADVNDSTSTPVNDVDFTSKVSKDTKGLEVALPKECLGEGVADDIKEAIQNAIKTLKSLGAVVEKVLLPNTKFGVPSHYVIALSETSSDLFRFDGIRYGYHPKEAHSLEELYRMSRSEGFGEKVKRRIFLGTSALSSGYYGVYYKKSRKVKTLIKNDFDKVFENYDVVVGPTASTTALNLGEEIDDPLTMYTNDLSTAPVNLAGLLGISVPYGRSNDRPIGLQFIGRPFDEKALCRITYQYGTQYNSHDIYKRL